jgi:hypothetical protein
VEIASYAAGSPHDLGTRHAWCENNVARASYASWLVVQIDFTNCATNVGLGERWWDVRYFVSTCNYAMKKRMELQIPDAEADSQAPCAMISAKEWL